MLHDAFFKSQNRPNLVSGPGKTIRVTNHNHNKKNPSLKMTRCFWIGNYSLFVVSFLYHASYTMSVLFIVLLLFKRHLANRNSLTQGNTRHPATVLNGFSIGPPYKAMSAIFWIIGERLHFRFDRFFC